MRVIPVRVDIARRFRDERGMVSLMVGVSAVALFGSAAIAVDLGNLWASRRHVIVATDAAALAAASDYAVGRAGCAIADGYVADNDEDAEMTACSPAATSPVSGYVSVEADTPVDYAFAGVLGFADRRVGSATTASWGIPAAVRGLRPFGLCEDDPNFRAWAANPRGISPVARVPYTNAPTDCGGAPGNWGIIDLDNTTPVAESDTQQWVRTGYSGKVHPGNVNGSPGAFGNNLDDDLASVQGRRFPIPVFDRVTTRQGGGGGGQLATFHVIGFVDVELVGWRTTGSEQDRYLEVRFVEMVAAGDCCENHGRDFGLRVVHICEVDPDFDPSNCSS